MSAITRRKFLQLAGSAMLLAALPVASGASKKAKPFRRAVRIRPLSTQIVTHSEQAFMRRARFECAADALRALASRGMTGEAYAE